MDYHFILEKLLIRQDLTKNEMHSVMHSIMAGELTESQIGAFLAAIRSKAICHDEIVGAAEVMRSLSIKVTAADSPHLIDTCGTGGDGKQTFNISTAAAFVAAVGGAKVAKHGNRSVSSNSGSADLLKEAGANIQLSPHNITEAIKELGFGFIFAPLHHQAMKYVAPIRQELKVRTMFNMLGPLTNPAGCKKQIIGVFSKEMLPTYAAALKELKAKHVLVVHSADGLDEISPAGITYCAELKEGKISEYEIVPEDFGMVNHPLSTISADSISASFIKVKGALNNQDPAAADTVALNAGAALYIAGINSSIKDGIANAKDIIASQNAMQLLNKYVSWSQKAS